MSMHIDDLNDIFIQELNEDELREQRGGQYFKPSIDGSFLINSINAQKYQSLAPR